jgi:ABC-2 type transport system ATP-binding protein
MSVKVEGITKIYGEQRAVDNVSFQIQPGEVVGFLGPNGAGKSTTMKILTSFIPPTSGKASIYDHDVMEDSMEVRKRTGYLPENNPLYLDMYVYEYLGFVVSIHRLAHNKAPIEEMIRLTGLTSESRKTIGQLSKGYRQRVGLVQALLHAPQVLILDEPTTGLDPN